MPNIINFTYTKADGKVSKRVLSPIVFPNKMFEGMDISELDTEQQVAYTLEMNVARDAFAAECARIQEKFDVKTMYRRFDPLKMTDVVNETL